MLPSISSDFNKSNEASWVGTSYVTFIQYIFLAHSHLFFFSYPLRYLLATCTFTPLYGRLSNVMGRSERCEPICCFICGHWYHGMQIIKQHANAYFFSICTFRSSMSLIDFTASGLYLILVSPRSWAWVVEGYLQRLRESRVLL